MKLRTQQRGLVSTRHAKNQRLGEERKNSQQKKKQIPGEKKQKKQIIMNTASKIFCIFVGICFFMQGDFCFSSEKKCCSQNWIIFHFSRGGKNQEICWNHLTYIAWYFLLGRLHDLFPTMRGVFGEFVVLRFKGNLESCFFVSRNHLPCRCPSIRLFRGKFEEPKKMSWNMYQMFMKLVSRVSISSSGQWERGGSGSISFNLTVEVDVEVLSISHPNQWKWKGVPTQN